MTPPRRLPWPLVALVAAVVAVAGCSGSPDVTGPSDATPTTAPATTAPAGDDTDDPTAEPAPEPVEVVSADETVVLTLPEGWIDVTLQFAQEDLELAVRAERMTADFFTNLVLAREEPIDDLAEAIEEAADDIAGEDGDYELLDPIEIAGAEALGYTVTRTSQGVEVAQTQWWIERDDRLYVLTLSSAQSEAQAAQADLEEILSTWRWLDEERR